MLGHGLSDSQAHHAGYNAYRHEPTEAVGAGVTDASVNDASLNDASLNKINGPKSGSPELSTIQTVTWSLSGLPDENCNNSCAGALRITMRPLLVCWVSKLPASLVSPAAAATNGVEDTNLAQRV